MGHKQDGYASRDHFLNHLDTLVSESDVAYAQRFIDDQNVGLHVHPDRKRQAHEHPTRIGLDGLIDELANVGKGDDVVEACLDFPLAQAEQRRIHVHVLAASEFGVEAGSKFEKGGDAALNLNTAASGVKRATDHLQESRFATAVTPDDANRRALLYFKREVFECPESVSYTHLDVYKRQR